MGQFVFGAVRDGVRVDQAESGLHIQLDVGVQSVSHPTHSDPTSSARSLTLFSPPMSAHST